MARSATINTPPQDKDKENRVENGDIVILHGTDCTVHTGTVAFRICQVGSGELKFFKMSDANRCDDSFKRGSKLEDAIDNLDYTNYSSYEHIKGDDAKITIERKEEEK